MARRKRILPVSALQSKLWPRLSRSNEDRALRYRILQAFGFSRTDAIRLRDLSDKKYFQLLTQAMIAQHLAR